MMKYIYTGLVSSLLLGVASAKTWTSADGEKSFEGEFKSYDEESEMVSLMRGDKELSFSIDKLSEEDQAWVKEQPQEEVVEEQALDPDEVAEELSKQEIGSKLTSSVLSKLEGKRFARVELTSVPEYYILYFSASW